MDFSDFFSWVTICTVLSVQVCGKALPSYSSTRGLLRQLVVDDEGVFVGGSASLLLLNADTLAVEQTRSLTCSRQQKRCGVSLMALSSRKCFSQDGRDRCLFACEDQDTCTCSKPTDLNQYQTVDLTPITDITLGGITSMENTVSIFANINIYQEATHRYVKSSTSLFVGATYDGTPASVRVPQVARYKLGPSKSHLDNIRPLSSFSSINKGSFKIRHGTWNTTKLYDRAIFTFAQDVYFVRYGMDDLKRRYETRLGRMCEDDTLLESYAEITLKCSSGGENYPEPTDAFLYADPNRTRVDDAELYVTFVNSNRSSSAICRYSIADLRPKLNSAVESCLNSTGQRVQWIYSGNSCNRQTVKWVSGLDRPDQGSSTGPGCQYAGLRPSSEQLCYTSPGNPVRNPGAYQPIPMTGMLMYSTPNQVFTALGAVAAGTGAGRNSRIAFVGTQDGFLAKVQLSINWRELTHFSVGRGPVLKESAFRFPILYALTPSTITRVDITGCGIYTTCSSCLTSEDPLQCGWCSWKSECTQKSRCQNTPTGWEPWSNGVCTPVIRQMSVSSSPLDGGTVVDVRGEDLWPKNNGKKRLSVIVTIGEATCRNVSATNSSRLTCITESIGIPTDTYVKVTVRNGATIGYQIRGSSLNTSASFFKYAIFSISLVTPSHGPAAGGTPLVIRGSNLNIGHNRTILVGGRGCLVDWFNSNSSHVRCVTPSKHNSTSPDEVAITMHIDNGMITAPHKFHYQKDPLIIRQTFVKALCGDSGSAFQLRFNGEHTLSVYRPLLRVWPSGDYTKDITVECKSTVNQIICATPRVPCENNNLIEYSGELILDNIRLHQSLRYYPMPVFRRFPNIRQLSPGGDLIIRGANITFVADVACSIEVTVGQLKCHSHMYDYSTQLSPAGSSCPVQTTPTTVICQPQLGDRLPLKNETFAVKVTITNRSFIIGNVTFSLPPVHRGSIASASAPVVSDGPSLSINVVIGICVGALIVFIVICTVVVCVWRKQKNKLYSNAILLGSDSSSGLRGEFDDDGKMGACSSWFIGQRAIADESFQLVKKNNLHIEYDHLVFGDELGIGHFGRVSRGELLSGPACLDSSTSIQTVAIKSMKNCSSAEDSRSFISEALVMKDLCHANLLTLVGLSFNEHRTPFIVLPFMSNGDLHTYIRSPHNNPGRADLIQFAIDVSCGMRYLHEMKYIHRDLALRNCMLNESMTVCVADFGMTKDLDQTNYYVAGSRKAMPIKWMAVESMTVYKFSTMSDVWSFGVLLWELFSRCASPYPGIDFSELIDYLQLGSRMSKPADCPDNVYRMMLECWAAIPKDRPSFTELCDSLEMMLHDGTTMDQYRNVPDVTDYLLPVSLSQESTGK